MRLAVLDVGSSAVNLLIAETKTEPFLPRVEGAYPPGVTPEP